MSPRAGADVSTNGAVKPETGKRRRVHQSTPENERAILEAVLQLAVKVGYEGTTMAEVARVAGSADRLGLLAL